MWLANLSQLFPLQVPYRNMNYYSLDVTYGCSRCACLCTSACSHPEEWERLEATRAGAPALCPRVAQLRVWSQNMSLLLHASLLHIAAAKYPASAMWPFPLSHTSSWLKVTMTAPPSTKTYLISDWPFSLTSAWHPSHQDLCVPYHSCWSRLGKKEFCPFPPELQKPQRWESVLIQKPAGRLCSSTPEERTLGTGLSLLFWAACCLRKTSLHSWHLVHAWKASVAKLGWGVSCNVLFTRYFSPLSVCLLAFSMSSWLQLAQEQK